MENWGGTSWRRAGDGVTTKLIGVEGLMIEGCAGSWCSGETEATDAAQDVCNAPCAVTAAGLQEPPKSLPAAIGLLATFCETMTDTYQPAVYVVDFGQWKSVEPSYLMPPDLIVVLFGEKAKEADPGAVLKSIWGRYRKLDDWKGSVSAEISMSKFDQLTHAIRSLGNYLVYAKAGEHLVDWPTFGVYKKEPNRLKKALIREMEPLEDVPIAFSSRDRESAVRRKVVKGGLLVALMGSAATAAVKGFKDDGEKS